MAGGRRIAEAMVVSSTGEIVAASREFRQGESLARQGLLPGGGVRAAGVTGLHLGATAEAASVFFLAPAGQGSGDVLLLRVPLEGLALLSPPLGAVPDSAAISVADQSGRVLYSWSGASSPDAIAGDDVSGTAIWIAGRNAPEEVWTGRDAGGVKRVVFYDVAAGAPWLVAVAFAKGELYEPLWGRLYVQIASLAGTAAVLALAMQYLLYSERRRMGATEESRRLFEATMMGAADGVLALDVRGAAVFANTRLGEVLQAPLSAVRGQGREALVELFAGRGEEREKVGRQVRAAMMEEGKLLVETVTLGGAAPGDFEVTSYPIRSTSGVIL